MIFLCKEERTGSKGHQKQQGCELLWRKWGLAIQPEVNYSSGLMFPMKNSFIIAKIPFPSLCSYTCFVAKRAGRPHGRVLPRANEKTSLKNERSNIKTFRLRKLPFSWTTRIAQLLAWEIFAAKIKVESNTRSCNWSFTWWTCDVAHAVILCQVKIKVLFDYFLSERI